MTPAIHTADTVCCSEMAPFARPASSRRHWGLRMVLLPPGATKRRQGEAGNGVLSPRTETGHTSKTTVPGVS